MGKFDKVFDSASLVILCCLLIYTIYTTKSLYKDALLIGCEAVWIIYFIKRLIELSKNDNA